MKNENQETYDKATAMLSKATRNNFRIAVGYCKLAVVQLTAHEPEALDEIKKLNHDINAVQSKFL